MDDAYHEAVYIHAITTVKTKCGLALLEQVDDFTLPTILAYSDLSKHGPTSQKTQFSDIIFSYPPPLVEYSQVLEVASLQSRIGGD